MTQPQRRQTFTSKATTKQQPQHTLTLDVLTTRPQPRPSVLPSAPTQPHRLHRSHSAAGGRCAPAQPPSRPRFGGLLTLTAPVPLLLRLLRPLLAGAAEGAAVRDSPQPSPFARPPVTVCLGDEDTDQAAGRGLFGDARDSGWVGALFPQIFSLHKFFNCYSMTCSTF